MPILDLNNKEELKRYNEHIKSCKYTRLTQVIEWSKVKENWKSEIVYLEEYST